MTDRTTRRRITILALLAILMGASSGHSEPFDRAAEYNRSLHEPAKLEYGKPAPANYAGSESYTIDTRTGHVTAIYAPVGDDPEPAPEPTPAPVPEVTPPAPITPTVESPTFGLKERYDVGEPCPATLLLPEGEKLIDVKWELPLRYIAPPDSLDTIHPYPIGVGSWPVRANYVVEVGGKLSIRWLIEPLTVGPPEPPAPPRPLIEIAGPDAPALYVVYYKLSKGSYTSLVHFHNVESTALADPDVGLSDSPVVPVIRDRLEKIAPFDGAKLVAELGAIAGELGKAPEPPTPPVPPVVEGKRYVAILSETEDNTPAMGILVNALRRGETAAYLKAKGHTLDVLDDDNPAPIVRKLVAMGVQEPALFVLDATTSAVLHSQPLPATAAEVLAAIKAHGG